MDSLKIDLDSYGQPATVRLKDEIEYGDLIVVQAHFDTDGATITHIRSDRKPKVRIYSAKEMDNLCAAWTEYQGRIVEHKAAQEAAEQAMIADASALASSVHFDLETLNVQIGKDEDDCWQICIPAIRFERYSPVDELKETVQEALDHIHTDVIRAEKYSWGDTGEWKAIVTSYRRVFPLEPQCRQCQKNDLPLNQQTGLCVRCIIDNETANKSEQGESLKVKVNLQAPELSALPE